MSIVKTLRTTALASVAALSATTVSADGGCAKGYRDITASEQATMSRVLETAKKSMPAPPDGWTIQGDDAVTVATTICIDQEAGPWTYEFMRHYQQVGDRDARNKIMQEATTDMVASMQAKQPRLDAIMAKTQALSQELATAAQQGDTARIDEISKELERYGKEYTAIVEEGGTTAKLNAANAAASRDLHMSVVARANSMFEYPDTRAETPAPPPGAKLAYRWTEKQGDADASHVLVLLGPWEPKGDGGLRATARAGAPAAAAQVLSVHVTADASRMAQTLDAIDFNALAATLAK